MSAKMALQRMERQGLIILPPPTHPLWTGGHVVPAITAATDPGPVWIGSRHQLPDLQLTLVRTRRRRPVPSRSYFSGCPDKNGFMSLFDNRRA